MAKVWFRPRRYYLFPKHGTNYYGYGSSSKEIIKSGTLKEEIVTFIKEAFQHCKTQEYSFESRNGFVCDVSLDRDGSSMVLTYSTFFPFVAETTGTITVHAIDRSMNDLLDILMLCELQFLKLSGLCDLSQRTLLDIGNRIAASTTTKVFEITGEITIDVASMLNAALAGTTSIQYVDFSTVKIQRHDQKEESERIIFKSLYDGFLNNSSTIRIVRLRACSVPLVVRAVLKGLAANVNSPSIEKIDISKSLCKTSETGEMICSLQGILEQPNSKLHTLHLCKLLWADEGALPSALDITSIGNALKTNTSLVDLDISANYLNDEGIESLLNGLQNNKTLQSIHLMGIEYPHHGGGNTSNETPDGFVRNSCLTTKGWETFLSGLRHTQGLQVLYLNNNEIDPIALPLLGEGLRHNRTLLKLYLNEIQGDNIKEINGIFGGLTTNQTLQLLDLSGNTFSLTSVEELATALKVNTTLQELILANCILTEDMLLTLAGTIPDMRGIHKIDLTACPGMNRRTAQAFVDAVRHNVRLISLQIANQRIVLFHCADIMYRCNGYADIGQHVNFFQILNRYRRQLIAKSHDSNHLSSSASLSSTSSPSFPTALLLSTVQEKSSKKWKLLPSLLFCLLKERLIIRL